MKIKNAIAQSKFQYLVREANHIFAPEPYNLLYVVKIECKKNTRKVKVKKIRFSNIETFYGMREPFNLTVRISDSNTASVPNNTDDAQQ